MVASFLVSFCFRDIKKCFEFVMIDYVQSIRYSSCGFFQGPLISTLGKARNWVIDGKCQQGKVNNFYSLSPKKTKKTINKF
jgi:hypothetical protein